MRRRNNGCVVVTRAESYPLLVACFLFLVPFDVSPAENAKRNKQQATSNHERPGAHFWEKDPTSDAQRIFGKLPSFDELLEIATSQGFVVIDAARSSVEEWDAFEASRRSGLEGSANAELRQVAEERKREYENVYRGVLGFAWLWLRERNRDSQEVDSLRDTRRAAGVEVRKFQGKTL